MKRSTSARALLGATAAMLVGGLAAFVPANSASAAASTSTVVYDAIGSTQAPSYPSHGFQARSTSAIGDFVQVGAGSRLLDSINVMMVSWACETGDAQALSCTSTPGHTFSHPLTLKVYAAGGTDAAPTVGALLASSTETFAIPYRPTAADADVCDFDGQWYNASTDSCQFGFAHKVTFDQFDPVLLPSKVIWSISYDTQTYGANPKGVAGPWNSLNVAVADVSGAPFAGTDLSPQGRFLASNNTGFYCAGAPANPTSELRFDSCAAVATQRPLASIVTTAPVNPAAVSSTVLSNAIGGEDDTTSEWSKDHFEPKVPGTESVLTDAVAVNGTNAPASATNGSLKLKSLGTNPAALQQARVVHHYDPATAPTLIEMLWSRPKYSVFADGATSNPNTGAPGAGSLQFGVQCGSWLASVVLSPGDANPQNLDVNNAAPAFNMWQTFQYPDPQDPNAKIFVATDGGTAPTGFEGFTQVAVSDLIHVCGNSKLTDARVSQGRSSYPSVVSYFDDVTFSNHTYDFVTAVAPTITSGAPAAGEVNHAYSFQLTATGAPAPAITVSGTLPSGVTANASGLLSGTPTQAGHFVFLVRASNGVAPDDVELVSIDIAAVPVTAPTITSGAPSAGEANHAYSFQLTASGTPASTITVVGTLPPGITASANGLLSGTPTAEGHYVFMVRASNGVHPDDVELMSIAVAKDSTPVTPAPAPDFNPIAPKRVFDTRPGQSPDAIRTVPKQRIGGSNFLEVQFTDLAGHVPAAGVGAVSINVTVVDPADAGFVTAFPCGERKLVSSVNFAAHRTVANAVLTPVSQSGTVCFFSSQETDLVVDVNGWFPTNKAFTAVGPARVLDTRAGESPEALLNGFTERVGGSRVLTARVVDLPGTVPATGVGAVSLNVTAVNPAADGFVTVYPCDAERPFVSSLNYVAGQTVANAVIAPVSAAGTVCLFSTADVDIVVDINGWLKDVSGFHAVSPARLFDTRPGESPNSLIGVQKAKIGGTDVLKVKATGLAGVVPATGVSAVSLNVTATNPEAAGFITVFPCGTRELVSSVNFVAGATVPNAVIAPLSAAGEICVYSSQRTDVVVDINGWFAG